MDHGDPFSPGLAGGALDLGSGVDSVRTQGVGIPIGERFEIGLQYLHITLSSNASGVGFSENILTLRFGVHL